MAKKQEETKQKSAKNSNIADQNGHDTAVHATAFQTLLDALPQNVYQKDKDGRFTYCNQTFLTSFNLTAEEVYGKTVHDLYNKEFADKFAQDDNRLLEDGQEINIVTEIESPQTGARGHIRIVKTLARNPEGDVIGTQGIWWDVTNRVDAEIDLRADQARLQTTLNAIIVPLLIVRDSDESILYANDNLSKLVNMPLDQLIGRPVPDFYYRQQDRERVTQTLEKRGYVPNLEMRLRKSDDELFWGLLSAQPCEFDGEAAILLTILDITERKQVAKAFEDALEATEIQAHRLSLLNELGAELNAVTTVDKVYTKAAEHIFHILPCDQASVALLNSTGDKFDVVMLQEELEAAVELDTENTVMAKVMADQQMMRLPKDAPLADFTDGRIRLEAGLHDAICTPLVVQGEVVGVLNIAAEKEDTFHDTDIGFVRQIGAMIANAIESRRRDERSRLLASIVENHPDFIGVGSLFGQAVYINPAGLQMLGLPVTHDVSQMLATDFYAEEEADLLMNEAIPSALQNEVWTGESNLRRTDGTLIPVDQIINVNYDIDNNPVSFAITMHDITERRESQAELGRQAAELATVAKVSTAVASTLDTEQLLNEVVNLTKSSFNLYHAHIYLLNNSEDELILTAGAGEIGDILVSEKHTISMNQKQSLVAQVARERQGLIANDVHALVNFLPHPALPDTRAELAVPMIAGEKLLGVLDIQADKIDYFSEQDLFVQSTLATEIAIALVNARTFEESEKSRDQLNELTRRLTREGWENYTESLTSELAYSYDLQDIVTLGKDYEADAVVMGMAQENLIHSLNIQGETIGQLALSVSEENMEDASEIVAAIAGSLSAHLENLRLTEQTQVALSETESLYNTSIQLNASTTLDQILSSAFELASRAGASSGGLYTFDLSDNGLPEWADLVATIGDAPFAKGTRAHIPEFILANLWLTEPKGAVLIGNVADDPMIEKDAKEAFKKEKTSALTVLPLTVGNRKIGQIVFRWQNARNFSNADQRIFNAIATQSASIVYSRLLFRQTDEALSETAALYQGSADLNTANTYPDVIKALRHHTLLGQNSSFVSINYFNHSWIGKDVPEWVDVLSFWNREEDIVEEITSSRLELGDFTSVPTLLSATKPTIIEDIVNDKRLDKKLQSLFRKQFKAKSAVFIPLVIGGQWVGYLLATYRQQASFPDQEIRRTIALSRQAAVAIENVRLFVQTQIQLSNLTTIQETTSQLTASRSFTEAVHALLPQLNKAAASDSADMHIIKDDMMTLIATYPMSKQENMMVAVPIANSMLINRAVETGKSYSTTINDPNLEAHEREILQANHVSAVVSVPLMTSQGALGVLTVKSTQPNRYFDEQEINLLQTLADQATIAFERVRLLDQTSKRAQREQTLREIAAKVRGSADVDVVLRTAVEEVGKVLGRQAYVYLQDKEQT